MGSQRGLGIEFGGNGETSFLPMRFTSKGFLFAIDIGTSSVKFIVALLLEVVKAPFVLGEVGDASASIGLVDISAKLQ